jgi:hypothetical protein
MAEEESAPGYNCHVFPLNDITDELRLSALLKMLSVRKKLHRIRKTLEFERISARINDKECSLLADLTGKANSR